LNFEWLRAPSCVINPIVSSKINNIISAKPEPTEQFKVYRPWKHKYYLNIKKNE